MGKSKKRTSSNGENSVNSGDDEENKPLLILVNPKSGTGHSQMLFEQHLEPLLKLHKIK